MSHLVYHLASSQFPLASFRKWENGFYDKLETAVKIYAMLSTPEFFHQSSANDGNLILT